MTLEKLGGGLGKKRVKRIKYAGQVHNRMQGK